MDMTRKKQVQVDVEWRDRLARFAASGHSVKQFCQAESVSAWSFYRWRKQLSASSATASPAGFIDAGKMPGSAKLQSTDPVPAPVAQLDVRLDLGHGLVLHIVRR